MVYKFRVILDTEEDIFRDIAILSEDTLEDFHNAIFNSFGFDGMEVASFYTCDDTWNQEDEIPMFDAGDVPGEQKTMSDYQLSDLLDQQNTKIIYVYDFDYQLSDLLDQQNTKIIYVYDFINMWTFLVELAAVEEQIAGNFYPETIFSHGEMPDEAMEKNFEADMHDDIYGEFEDDLDEDDLDMFSGDDSFEDYGTEENW